MSTERQNRTIVEIRELKKVFHLGLFRKRVDAVKNVFMRKAFDQNRP
jgi:hypothetical protein